MSELTESVFEMDEDTQKDRYLTFSLDKEDYGIEIKYVTEIVGIQEIITMPELPEYVKGIINLRGKIIPIMDVRMRFKKEPVVYNNRTCVIVIEINDLALGLVVDRVSDVLTIPEQNIVEVPMLNNSLKNRFIKSIGKVENGVKLLLDCEMLLTHDELEELSIKL